ncbi:ketopantoate reductase family protein [Paenibacillus medicaginis]|uniref:Ketopantoate reductase family protein n=1 Tax=Paenibacillus medicaginis TaxID=1470560 RepID=A0ABV5C3X3_9BACL
MKILIYGAGVLGSYLAHALVRGDNNVTMLARGRRLDELRDDGNVLRHHLQLRTTVDKVNVISELQPEDVYDLIFVVMKYPDFRAVLPALAANHSRHVVIVGNNASPHEMQDYLQANSPVQKKIAFAFIAGGGWKETGRVVSVHGPKGQMTIGGLGEELDWRAVIDQTFTGAKFKVTFYNDMEEWLKSHFMLILPLNSIAAAYDGDLRKAVRDSRLLNQVIDAIDEGHQVLEKLGYTVTPELQKDLPRKKRLLLYMGLKLMLKVPVVKNLLSDKAISQNEVSALQQAFNDLKQKAGIPTPNWDKLASYSSTSS